ncbi:MAG: hypothetical protein FJ088_16785, partial [Deltaproteobacteria bacterium]|nr:hypothetical protein [Deltaproteobacteria bacterium]
TIHVPAGSIPKDGPSAGLTMFVALYSLITGKKIRSDVAMTGEITLRGLVLPVGGIKNKVLAAQRGGVKKVILPERNKKDLIEIPEQIREEMEFIFIKRMDDVLTKVLDLKDGESPFLTAKAAKKQPKKNSGKENQDNEGSEEEKEKKPELDSNFLQ